MTTARDPGPTLKTSRLILRPWRDDDIEPFAAMDADPRVMEHFPAAHDRSETEALFARIRAHFAEHGFGPWAVEVPGVAPFIGLTGLFRVSFESHFTPAIELGWRIAHEHWGCGYATEAADASKRFGFEQLGADQLVAYTVPSNARSRRVMEKLGMTHDADGDFDHPRVPEGHALRRHVLYRIRR